MCVNSKQKKQLLIVLQFCGCICTSRNRKSYRLLCKFYCFRQLISMLSSTCSLLIVIPSGWVISTTFFEVIKIFFEHIIKYFLLWKVLDCHRSLTGSDEGACTCQLPTSSQAQSCCPLRPPHLCGAQAGSMALHLLLLTATNISSPPVCEWSQLIFLFYTSSYVA